MESFPDLDFIINTKNFQKIQDCLSDASELAMVTVDLLGKRVTTHSCCSEYCSLVRSIDPLNELCRKCDSRGGIEAARIGKPYIYECHMGVVDVAIPIIVEGHYYGAIMAGQIVLKETKKEQKLEKIVDSLEKPLDKNLETKLKELHALLPVMDLDKVQVVADMMFQITNYIIEEALIKINLNDTLESHIDSFNKNSNNLTENENSLNQRPVYNSPIINPALEYIKVHYEERIKLDDMSYLCNISSSYFSKLFKRITGEHFANYINKIRVTKACDLLINTDTPITVIAMDLGFGDNSYFNKVFKKLIGITPSLYKIQHQKKHYY
jgi:ligand-binding sensor protein/AraC-like DNA-binding protein